MSVHSKLEMVCGRPNVRKGSFCKNKVYMQPQIYEIFGKVYPCGKHTTPESLEVSTKLDALWREGVAAGQAEQERMHFASAQMEEYNSKRKAEMQAREQEAFEELLKSPDYKTHDSEGNQLIVVRGYTYKWSKSRKPLQVGDTVMLPGSHWNPSPWKGTVSQLGSDYDGYVISALEKVLTEDV